MRWNSLDHALAIADVYFSVKSNHWFYECKEQFTFEGKKYVWAPDIITSFNGKLYAIEVQLSSMSATSWARKWKAWNLYFKESFKTAKYQQWSKSGKIMLPTFVVITKNKKAAEGFSIPQRELIVIESINKLC